jgi:hypothetical protein
MYLQSNFLKIMTFQKIFSIRLSRGGIIGKRPGYWLDYRRVGNKVPTDSGILNFSYLPDLHYFTQLSFQNVSADTPLRAKRQKREGHQ